MGVNCGFSDVPMTVTAPMTTTAISARMRPYSAIAWPSSFLMLALTHSYMTSNMSFTLPGRVVLSGLPSRQNCGDRGEQPNHLTRSLGERRECDEHHQAENQRVFGHCLALLAPEFETRHRTGAQQSANRRPPRNCL